MGEPEALRGRGPAELRERLARQERLLSDRKFISRLPDKGKKISACAEKLKVAIAQEEERRRKTELLSMVRLSFQKRQAGLNSSKCGIATSEANAACEDSSWAPASQVNKELGSAVQNQPRIWSTKTRAKDELELPQQVHEDSGTHQTKERLSKASAPSGFPCHSQEESADRSSEGLVEALERISVGGKELDAECGENLFQGLPQQTPQRPHYIEVLERRTKNPVWKKSAFRPNRIPAELSGSSHSSSEAPSPRGDRLPISAEERRRREKQHLDDITAARLPVLHHAPALLLPLEESLALQVQQKAAYEEMQAKFAAQKLAQKLGIKMVAYEPEGEAGVSYREVKDEEGYSSAED